VKSRAAAFVISHPYVDALACFREPIARLAREGWQVDLYTSLSQWHPAPVFASDRVRLIPIEMSKTGAAALVSRLVIRRPRYAWILAVPQWSLYYASKAAAVAQVPLVCLSDELTSQAEAVTEEQKRWKARERRAHQQCALTIALSQERADFIRHEHELAAAHEIFVVPNASAGPARRLRSRYYQDTLDIDDEARVLLHAGSWWWKRQFAELEYAPRQWQGRTVLVFQGRMTNHLGAVSADPHLRVSETQLPAQLMPYAVSSAHVGLALYDEHTANNRRMGWASGKVLTYLKSALPVVVSRHPSFGWIESSGCGVSIDGVEQIEDAVDCIFRRYDEHVSAVMRYCAAHLDFDQTFAPVLDRLHAD
jgi:hypothetical protein